MILMQIYGLTMENDIRVPVIDTRVPLNDTRVPLDDTRVPNRL